MITGPDEFGGTTLDDPVNPSTDYGGMYEADFPDNPNQRPGFEIRAVPAESDTDTQFSTLRADANATGARDLTFVPDYYPDRFTQTKKKELARNGRQCAGESVSIKTIKNREFHVQGILLEYEVPAFQKLLDHEGPVEILSPLTPHGGMECIVKNGELGNQQGYDPHAGQWMFEYTVDLVSTGDDEYNRGRNAIVSAIIEG